MESSNEKTVVKIKQYDKTFDFKKEDKFGELLKYVDGHFANYQLESCLARDILEKYNLANISEKDFFQLEKFNYKIANPNREKNGYVIYCGPEARVRLQLKQKEERGKRENEKSAHIHKKKEAEKISKKNRKNKKKQKEQKATELDAKFLTQTVRDNEQTEVSPNPIILQPRKKKDIIEVLSSSSEKDSEPVSFLKLAKKYNPVDLYDKWEELGEGAQGVVYSAMNKHTNRIVAIKRVEMKKAINSRTLAEIEIHKDVHHRNIVEFIECLEYQNFIWIVMELMDGGDLLELLEALSFIKKHIPEEHIAYLIRELLQGIEFLHSNNKIHRDIKSANVLLNQKGEVKLADFGLAASLGGNTKYRTTDCGTPLFMAPERLEKKQYNDKADIWSIGVLCYELAHLKAPFWDDSKMSFEQLRVQVLKNGFIFNQEEFSEEFENFTRFCLIKNPDYRPSADYLLKHPFLKKASSSEKFRNYVAIVYNDYHLKDSQTNDTNKEKDTEKDKSGDITKKDKVENTKKDKQTINQTPSVPCEDCSIM